MKNKIADLNNHLFAQLERLGEEGLTAEQIASEVQRTEAICAVSEQLIKSAAVSLKAAELIADHGGLAASNVRNLAPMLEGSAEKAR